MVLARRREVGRVDDEQVERGQVLAQIALGREIGRRLGEIQRGQGKDLACLEPRSIQVRVHRQGVVRERLESSGWHDGKKAKSFASWGGGVGYAWRRDQAPPSPDDKRSPKQATCYSFGGLSLRYGHGRPRGACRGARGREAQASVQLAARERRKYTQEWCVKG